MYNYFTDLFNCLKFKYTLRQLLIISAGGISPSMYGNRSTQLTQKKQSTKTTNEPENEEEDNESILSNEDTISEVMSEDTLSNLSDEDRDKNHDLLPQTDLQEQQQPNNVESRQEEEEKSAKQNKVAMAAVTQGEQ